MKKLLPIILFAVSPSAFAYLPISNLIFTGRYEFRTDEESLDIIGLQVCFFISTNAEKAASSTSSQHSKTPWFCFSNSALAAKELGFKLEPHEIKGCGMAGKATVSVTNYQSYNGEGDGNDVAKLEAFLEKSKPELITCPK